MSRKKQVVGAFAVIFNEKEEILLGQRNEKRNSHPFHKKWSFPGGGVEFGEHPEDALKREVREEVGIEIELLSHYPIVFSHVHQHADDSDQDFLLFYPAKYIRGRVTSKHDSGTMDARWFKIDEIDFRDCVPETRETIMEVRKHIKYFNVWI